MTNEQFKRTTAGGLFFIVTLLFAAAAGSLPFSAVQILFGLTAALCFIFSAVTIGAGVGEYLFGDDSPDLRARYSRLKEEVELLRGDVDRLTVQHRELKGAVGRVRTQQTFQYRR